MNNTKKLIIIGGGVLLLGVVVVFIVGSNKKTRKTGYWMYRDSSRVYYSDNLGVIYFSTEADFLNHRKEKGFPMDYTGVSELDLSFGVPASKFRRNPYLLDSDTPRLVSQPSEAYKLLKDNAIKQIQEVQVDGRKGCTISVACNYDETASVPDNSNCDFTSCY